MAFKSIVNQFIVAYVLIVILSACANNPAPIPQKQPAPSKHTQVEKAEPFSPGSGNAQVTPQPSGVPEAPAPSSAQQPPPHISKVDTLTAQQLFERVRNSIVVVRAYNSGGQMNSQGSGVILPFGRIVTNCHVIANASTIEIGQGEEKSLARLVAGDGNKDLCLLAAMKNIGTAATIGRTSSLRVGEPLYAVGSPMGLELSLSDGLVAQLRGSKSPIIQMTAPISPGSSGGGVFNAKGELVGISALYIAGGQNLNFALPIEWVEGLPAVQSTAVITTANHATGNWLARAVQLEAQQDWQALADWAKRWVQAEPDQAIAWGALGNAYDNLGQHSKAIGAFSEALRIKPNYAEAWSNLGSEYISLNQPLKAIEAFNEALRIKPDLAMTWNNVGIAYGQMGQHNKAAGAFGEALRIKPNYAEAWSNLGSAYVNSNQPVKAIEAISEALQIEPDNAMAWNSLGVAYFLLGDRTKALQMANRAEAIEPGSAQKLLRLIFP